MGVMWPFDIFKKKAKPDYSKLEKEDKELLSEEELAKADSEFKEESEVIDKKLMTRTRKL
jgi:hypothetical protein